MAKACRIPSRLPKSRAARARLLNRLIDCQAVVARGAITPAGDRRWKKLNQTLQRLRGNTLAGVPSWWPFKKKAKRHPMSHTIYMMKTPSGRYVPMTSKPVTSMAGARRRRKRRR